ncbi:riboflavin synthase [Companilactobacillus sp. HBUAS56257]|uniref:riboflavin synthase n=2 Tax=unclassified Companilactobacillus TaxID=2767904 RepID=UPI002FF3E550
MFTGIVKGIGKVQQIKQSRDNLSLVISHHLGQLELGDSIAIDGICLTVTQIEKARFQVDVMPETVKKTNINDFQLQQEVNLEPALQLNSKIGGHFVLGHVDTTGQLLAKKRARNSDLLIFSIDPKYSPYLVEKGSITIDGVSLTIISVQKDQFQVGIIPFTQEKTVLGALKLGDVVNLETDILGKYVYRNLRGSQND